MTRRFAWTMTVALLWWGAPAAADNCGAPDDCSRAPENIGRTTSLGIGVAILVLIDLLINGDPRRRGGREPEPDDADEEPLEPLEDIFGPADGPDEPGGPPGFVDRPLGEPPDVQP